MWASFSSYQNKITFKHMSAWLIIVTGGIYAFIAAEQLYRGNAYMAVVYAGYAFSNVGLYFLAK